MDKRTDPVEIIARVGGVTPYSDRERAFGTWVYLASQAGWQVVEVEGFAADSDRGEIGAVDVEGGSLRDQARAEVPPQCGACSTTSSLSAAATTPLWPTRVA